MARRQLAGLLRHPKEAALCVAQTPEAEAAGRCGGADEGEEARAAGEAEGLTLLQGQHRDGLLRRERRPVPRG